MVLQRKIKILTMLLGLLSLVRSASAQDNVKFNLHVSPFMQLRALGADQSATHPMTGSNVNFNNQRWQTRTSSGSGSTVQFSSDHAFHNLADSNYKRDVRLRLTRIVGTNGAGWAFDTIVDTTNYAAADETATVQVHSIAPGNAIIWMDVSFMTGNLATLKGGQYQMTVVGTISEN